MKIIGIDNGLDGGLALLTDTTPSFVWPMPTLRAGDGSKREYAIDVIVQYLKRHTPDHVFIERAQAMPGQGVTSMFSIGKGYGVMLGVLAALQIPHTIVHPKTWQKELFRDCAKKDTKAASVMVASRMWPGMDWRANERCRTPHDGMTDATLIAEYGRRTLKV